MVPTPSSPLEVPSFSPQISSPVIEAVRPDMELVKTGSQDSSAESSGAVDKSETEKLL